jgi:hypothetical protein
MITAMRRPLLSGADAGCGKERVQFCEQCGSASHDKDGYCGGCGAKWRAPAHPGGSERKEPGSAETGSRSPYDDLPAKIAAIGIHEIRPKNPGLAVTLAVLLGPFGLLYSSTIGTVVMLIVAVALRFWLGVWSFLIVLPICGFWAWKAARDSSSAFD